MLEWQKTKDDRGTWKKKYLDELQGIVYSRCLERDIKSFQQLLHLTEYLNILLKNHEALA